MKAKHYYILCCMAIAALSTTMARAQGCVAVKNMSSHTLNYGDESPAGWQFSLNYRYFRSFRHFKGKEEQKERLKDKTEVINNDNSIILSADYRINGKWSIGVSLPFVFIDRSSLYEHDRMNRYHSQSSGLGDARIIGRRTFAEGALGVFQVGLGVKLPTGNYNYKDYFHTADGLQKRPVDQSIQPGDGGTGIIVELNGAKNLSDKFQLILNTMYMFNPRNTNGTRTFRETLSPLLANEAIMSVADQYFARLVGRYQIGSKLGFSAGLRLEGIPVEDLLGKSGGFRRPGYILSAEPSLDYMTGQHFFSVNVPIAMVRNRTQSVTDKQTQLETGNPRHGDAAFADYLISVTYAYQLAR